MLKCSVCAQCQPDGISYRELGPPCLAHPLAGGKRSRLHVVQGMDVRSKLVADCMEALLGVAFIEGGLAYTAHTLVRWQLLDPDLLGHEPDWGPVDMPANQGARVACARAAA